MSDDDSDLTESVHAFLGAFDAHARATDSELAVDFLDTFRVESALVLCLHIGAEGVLLLTAGVHIEGDRLRADELHNSCSRCPTSPRAWPST